MTNIIDLHKWDSKLPWYEQGHRLYLTLKDFLDPTPNIVTIMEHIPEGPWSDVKFLFQHKAWRNKTVWALWEENLDEFVEFLKRNNEKF